MSKSMPQLDQLSRDDIDKLEIVERLSGLYGKTAQMGILDRSYNFFVNNAQTGALCYKVQDRTAIVAGDPLCKPGEFPAIVDEFRDFRKQFGWGVAFMGITEPLFKHLRQQGHCTTMQFSNERVLNPMTNDVLLEKSGKRIVVQNKKLLNPSKDGITLGVYSPTHGIDPSLQHELMDVYETWRKHRNQVASSQSYITVYNSFDFPNLMIYIYTRRSDGVANGFAALRRIGADQGYHLDPCIAAPDAPKGINELLLYSAMALLKQMGISYLSLGFEPVKNLSVTGLPPALEKMTHALYSRALKELPMKGKKAYHDKFHPDPFLESRLYLVFASGVPGVRQMLAVIHMANVSVRELIKSKTKDLPKYRRSRSRKLTSDSPVEEPAAVAS